MSYPALAFYHPFCALWLLTLEVGEFIYYAIIVWGD